MNRSSVDRELRLLVKEALQENDLLSEFEETIQVLEKTGINEAKLLRLLATDKATFDRVGLSVGVSEVLYKRAEAGNFRGLCNG